MSFSLVPSCFNDSSSDDESVESSSDYEVSDDNTKKAKSKNKSGIFYHPSDEVVKKQLWPQIKASI